MSEKINKSLLGIAGEYSVAAEFAKRNIYAQLTLGNQKRTDLLIFSEQSQRFLKVEVKCKQTDTWPNCRGISSDQSVIVFVDFKKLEPSDRPNFYVLDNHDWSDVVREKERLYSQKHPNKRTEIINNVLRLLDEVNSQGKVYEGCSVRVSDIEKFKERWDKVTEKLGVTD